MSLRLSRRTALAGGLGSAIAMTLAACGSSSDGGVDGLTVDGEVATISIGASPVPHVTILNWVQENLAADAGISLDIVELNDYRTPNIGLDDGSLAANFFQTPNYLAQQIDELGYDFTAIADVHIEPMGVYTDKGYTSIDEIADGGKVILNDDPANTARGLRLLASGGLIELDESVEMPTTDDITSNPKNLDFPTVDGAQVYSSMADAEAAVINGNYALDNGLNPNEDALLLEEAGESPYANQLVVRTADKDNKHLVALAGLLNSEELRTFIEQEWTNGAVLPAF
ncbi:MAG: MetQ/NlpA family ABC transporter substrate-binding protein [Actinomyces sp.]|uniref:MetQ/NlpA family ABC transporter substrate-binding protein n=1 Tax=Actinomyces sp. TaxID=29317 RepID=UPI0026DAECDB|nr:MetQ/NlpA family ABC transporter substrate-binding protein [Actinomyces sp.]MDO4243611.1 MetQ/NlpA family ABC transporter substrate-binding protein [Actinomyces sp.]